MAEYDGLPLNTPTLISEDANFETWATRTVNGGTVERRVKPGSAAQLIQQRELRIAQAVPVLRQWAADARNAPTATSGNVAAQFEVVKDRLATFFDNFADLLESLGKD